MLNVMLVDDDPDNLLLVRTWLERMGHHVTVAASATEALLVLGKRSVPDLAVIDIVLPDLDGVRFLTKLRQDNPAYASMPVIFLTAADLPSRPDQDDVPMARFVPKPLTRAMLSAAITAASPPPGTPAWNPTTRNTHPPPGPQIEPGPGAAPFARMPGPWGVAGCRQPESKVCTAEHVGGESPSALKLPEELRSIGGRRAFRGENVSHTAPREAFGGGAQASAIRRAAS